MVFSLEQKVRLLLKEGFRNRNRIVAGFIIINLTLLSIGLVWPKVYESYVTVLVENKKVIQPLMQGVAVTTTVADHAKNAREILYSRNFIFRIMEAGKFLKDNPTPLQQEKLLEKLKRNIRVSIVGRNIIKIAYRDDNPERAQLITQKLATLFVEESRIQKTRESRAAYEFIDKQVREFHRALVEAENRLKEFRSATLEAKPGTEGAVVARIERLQNTLEATRVELRETIIKKKALEKELSGEAGVSLSLSREGQYQLKIAELQSQLDTLRLSYHETYPDVIRLKNQIEDLKKAILMEQERRREAKEHATEAGTAFVDESVVLNPLTEELRSRLSRAKTTIATLEARLSETQKLLDEELARGRRIHVSEATLAELTRDYEVNRDIYQELLRKREQARLSMNLDLEEQGLTLRIYEPAFLPIKPSGIRFLHFALFGLVAGLVVPFGLLYAFQQFDARVRNPMIINEKLALPLLGVVPSLPTPQENRQLASNFKVLALALFANMTIFVSAGWLKYSGVL